MNDGIALPLPPRKSTRTHKVLTTADSSLHSATPSQSNQPTLAISTQYKHMTDIHPKELLHKILRYAKGEGEYDPSQRLKFPSLK